MALPKENKIFSGTFRRNACKMGLGFGAACKAGLRNVTKKQPLAGAELVMFPFWPLQRICARLLPAASSRTAIRGCVGGWKSGAVRQQEMLLL